MSSSSSTQISPRQKEGQWVNLVDGAEELLDQSPSLTMIRKIGLTTGSGGESTIQVTTVGFNARVEDQRGRLLFRISTQSNWKGRKVIVENAKGDRVGSVRKRFHMYKRKYDLYIGQEVFGHVCGGAFSWSFPLLDTEERIMGCIGRESRGTIKNMFSSKLKYVLDMEAIQDPETTRLHPLTTTEKVIMLSAAVLVDFEHFTHHPSTSVNNNAKSTGE
ncbi:MAG: Scramblase-domain-containing protein [Piptocephalis tieghemiana]|nr:MAG: Scramblase-domain-containing protein [Piptocephalis tieghemiana]